MFIIAGFCALVALYTWGLYWRGVKQRQHLTSYIVYLLFRDDIRSNHSTKLADFIAQQPGDAVSVGAATHNAIGRLADDLALNGNSLLTAHQLILSKRTSAAP